MLSRNELENLVNIPEYKLTHEERMGKRSVESRGLPYYGRLKSKFPSHFNSFSNMHKRKKEKNIEISENFSRNAEGFINFLLYLGDMTTEYDTLGRIDHSKGYIEGNFKWEPSYENYKESAIRNGNHLITPAHVCHWKYVIEILDYLENYKNQILHINKLYKDLNKINSRDRQIFRQNMNMMPFVDIIDFNSIRNFKVKINDFDINIFKNYIYSLYST